MGYQHRDRHILDYKLFELPGVAPYPGNGLFRGPQPLTSDYIACVGAAQTFGCFVEEPFAVLLSKRLSIECLNLGYGGAGPTFHHSNPKILEYINKSKLAIVQVLSGRSQSNSAFKTLYHGMEGVRTSDGRILIAAEFYTDLLERDHALLHKVIEETKRNYVANMKVLLQHITVPKILFWFSVRPPHYQAKYRLPLYNLWGAFPQFVDQTMMEELVLFANDYVECVTSRGLPQKLFDKQGNPTVVVHSYNLLTQETRTEAENNYYPSPEMHADAAAALAEYCLKYLE